MKANDFRDMIKNEITVKVASLKEELFSNRFKMATGQIENSNLLKTLKRDIARGLTVLRETELVEKKNNG